MGDVIREEYGLSSSVGESVNEPVTTGRFLVVEGKLGDDDLRRIDEVTFKESDRRRKESLNLINIYKKKK